MLTSKILVFKSESRDLVGFEGGLAAQLLALFDLARMLKLKSLRLVFVRTLCVQLERLKHGGRGGQQNIL